MPVTSKAVAVLRVVSGGGGGSSPRVDTGGTAANRGRVAGDSMELQFNPTTVQFQKSARWESSNSAGAQDTSTPEYKGPNPGTLSFQALFNEYDLGTSGDVTKYVEKLVEWTVPESGNRSETPSAVSLQFVWGSFTFGPCYMDQVNATYTMFRADGVPVVAECDITLKEMPDPAEGQNPTSGGEPGNRSHLVIAGETLQSVAYAEYRDAGLWRALAVANDIDDPNRVSVGTRLRVPPHRAARELA